MHIVATEMKNYPRETEAAIQHQIGPTREWKFHLIYCMNMDCYQILG